ncbi:hypothetical protein MMC18_001316 [Xylographa bjoerkii]|nr:hypothetical protein [Xylographa bjoerkii]
MVFDNDHLLMSQLEGDIDPQLSCPLFKLLPPEIRHLIFSFALTAYDYGKPYHKGTFHDRPGYHYPRRINTELLRTCKNIYLECCLLPVMLNEIVCWRAPDRGPPDYKEPETGPLPGTVEQIAVTRLHIFTQQAWLECWASVAEDSQPSRRIIHFTIRHTDWWDWEHGRALHLDPKQAGQASQPFCGESEPFPDDSWGGAFRHLHGLQQFVLELETVKSKRAELDGIIVRAAGWHIPLGDGNILVLDESRTVYSAWRGLDRFYDNPSNNIDNPGWEDILEPYQTPKLKPGILEMAEDFLNAQEASGLDELDALNIHGLGNMAPPSPQMSKLESSNQALERPAQALESLDPASHVPRSKAMTSEIAHRIIAEVRSIQGFRPAELARIYGYVQTGLTEAQIMKQAYREMEDMLALHYYVVKLTWIAKPGPVERDSKS